MGAGVAGSYLLNRLDGHQVECFEMRPQDKWYTVCAWGTSEPYITEMVKKAGFNFSDYVLHRGTKMTVDSGHGTFDLPLRGMVSYDKHRLCEDMLKGHTVHWGTQVKQLDGKFEDFDLVVDATGMQRALLPKVKNDIIVPCIEYQVKSKKFPWDDFYIKPYPGLSGYLWYFPLWDGVAHIGAGEIHGGYKGEIEAMLKKYDCEVIRKIGRPVRIVPPSMCGPFYVLGRCKKCGRQLRRIGTPNGGKNIKGKEAEDSGSNSDPSASISLTNSGANVTSAEAAISSNFTTRDTEPISRDTRSIETPGPLIGKQSTKQISIPHGSRLSVPPVISKSRGYSTTQNKGESYCNCQEPLPDRPAVVGVGESIGTVFPMLGEGIIPSMQCAEILIKNIDNMEAYTAEVLRHTEVYTKGFRFVMSKIEGKFSLMSSFPRLFSVYLYMRGNEKRFGMKTRLSDLLKLSKL